jgi:hypothetical protein
VGQFSVGVNSVRSWRVVAALDWDTQRHRALGLGKQAIPPLVDGLLGSHGQAAVVRVDQ